MYEEIVEKVRRNVCRGSEEWAESKVSGYNWGGEFGGRNEFKSLIQVQGVLPRRGVVRMGAVVMRREGCYTEGGAERRARMALSTASIWLRGLEVAPHMPIDSFACISAGSISRFSSSGSERK